MEIRICVTEEAQAGRPLTIEACGMSVTLSGLAPGSAATVTDGGGGLAVRVAGAGGLREGAAEPDGRAAWQEAQGQEAPQGTPEGEEGLFGKLSALRKQAAAEAGVPPYVVFHDNTLREMCRLLPGDLAALGAVQGVGRAKLEKYGALFLEGIRAHASGGAA